MEITFSEDFKRFFLLNFTKELILQSMDKDILRLQEIVRSRDIKLPQKLEKQNIPPEKIIEKKIPVIVRSVNPSPIPSIMSTRPPLQGLKPAVRRVQGRPISRGPRLRPGIRQSLYIPEPSLPSHLEYLKPVAGGEIDIDFQKLNSIVKDPGVRIIECNPDEKVKVIGTMGTRTTGIVLTREEIDSIVDKFSIASKIPVEEGIYRVVVGNYILSAIISEVIGSRFILKKITPTINRPYQSPRGIPMKRVITKETTINHLK